MKKRIVICADGTWNRPEKDLEKDVATNVLRLARAIQPVGTDGVPQQVFYDWGIGSYYDPIIGGATGKGLDKNIMDDYRYIVQNYEPGDEIFLFGFSRGAYTVRCVCGLINNCGILKRPDARLIQEAFTYYKRSSRPYAPDGEKSVAFRVAHSHPSRDIKFVGVWDTVGALGIPLSFMGLLENDDVFYDRKIGRNARLARHALAIDELREDFIPTIWEPRDEGDEDLDVKQVWFAGAHSDVGGGYQPDKDGTLLSDVPLEWMMGEAKQAGLTLETHLNHSLKPNVRATVHLSRRKYYRLKPKHHRAIRHENEKVEVLIHNSVKERWDADEKYRPPNLDKYVKAFGWQQLVGSLPLGD